MTGWAHGTVMELKTELERHEQAERRSGLSATGLEAILIGIAIKILVSVGSSVAVKAGAKGVAQVLKQVSGPKDLGALEAETVSLKRLLRQEVLDETNLKVIEQELVANGIPENSAKPIATKLAAIIQERASQ